MSILIDEAEQKRLQRLCEAAYPGRAPAVLTKLADAAKWVYWPGKSDEENLQSIKDLGASHGADFTRATPTPADYLAFVEKDRTSRGLSWEPADRMSALRRAEGMSPDELLSAVPSDFKAPAAAPAPAQRAPANETERLDAEIQARTGKDPRQMWATERRALHDALKAELAAPQAKAAGDIPPQDFSNPMRARERITAARAAAKK